MEAPEIGLTLIPAPDDPPLKSPAYQADLRGFKHSLDSQGLEVSCEIELRESWVPDHNALSFIIAPYLGDFIVKLTPVVGTALGGALGAWLHARYGRKVRLKVGEVEAEAQTIEEVKKLLDHAEQLQQRNQSKIIHEP